MGIAQSTMHNLVGTVGVGATMLSRTAKNGNKEGIDANALNAGVMRGQIPISEANDGERSKQMADKARKNLQAMKQAKLNIRKIRIDNNLTDRQKSIRINKEINKLGGNE